MNIVILSCWTIKNVDDITHRLVFADKWEFPMWEWKQGEDNNHTTFFQGTKLEWFRAKSWWLIVWINIIIYLKKQDVPGWYWVYYYCHKDLIHMKSTNDVT